MHQILDIYLEHLAIVFYSWITIRMARLPFMPTPALSLTSFPVLNRNHYQLKHLVRIMISLSHKTAGRYYKINLENCDFYTSSECCNCPRFDLVDLIFYYTCDGNYLM